MWKFNGISVLYGAIIYAQVKNAEVKIDFLFRASQNQSSRDVL